MSQQPNNVRYRIIKTVECVEECGKVMTYGICCREDKNQQNRRRVKYHTVPNISTRTNFVEELVARLIANNADPVHLMDLIYDYLP